MVLMVVVVVAVGGLFVRPFAYLGDPRLHLGLWKNLWKSLRISLWISRPEDTYLCALLDGSPMCKIDYLDGPAMCETRRGRAKDEGRYRGDGAILFCLSLFYDMFTT